MSGSAGDSARLLPDHALAYICRGGPNDSAVNVWSFNSSLIMPPISGAPDTFRIFNISTGILVGTIPQGAWIQSVEVYVITAFNASGNNTLTCGTVNSGTLQGSLPGTFNNLIASGDITATLTGMTQSGRGLGPQIPLSNDQDVYIQYTQTGTPATQGNALLLITFTGLVG